VKTGGDFENRDQIYQERFVLPHVGGYYAQISTFTAAGRYAGACLRVDASEIISMESENLALRVVKDRELSDLSDA
jgi:glutathionylspermidine amidase/synthetase